MIISGDPTGILRGDPSDIISGDPTDCKITAKEREAGIKIEELIED